MTRLCALVVALAAAPLLGAPALAQQPPPLSNSPQTLDWAPLVLAYSYPSSTPVALGYPFAENTFQVPGYWGDGMLWPDGATFRTRICPLTIGNEYGFEAYAIQYRVNSAGPWVYLCGINQGPFGAAPMTDIQQFTLTPGDPSIGFCTIQFRCVNFQGSLATAPQTYIFSLAP